MDMNRFTQKAQQAVLDAQSLVGEYHHSEITPEHLLLALLNQSDGVAPEGGGADRRAVGSTHR